MKKSKPVKGCHVLHADIKGQRGIVIQTNCADDNSNEVQVDWGHGKKKEWISPDKLKSGLQLGMSVQDIPRSNVRKSLGQGEVLNSRTLGGREQVLVEFASTGQRHWLPYENLRVLQTLYHKLIKNNFGGAGNAENFRLRTLAHGLQQWNENTGALSKLEIDPLPHQIHLVHHILKSGNLNWLIADDVGLGKTIEVGMLLSALTQRRTFKRILLITPAGLVNNWKEELHYKFGLSDFRIYGTDFTINDPRDWKHYDQVIASMDMLKLDQHTHKIMQADEWDLIVFDEAHRLGRTRYGAKLEANDRYRLAFNLRKRTESILLLSATPHQGDHEKFRALLELIRPAWRKQIADMRLKPDFLREMVFRNNKSEVRDAEGKRIFAGKETNAIDVPRSIEEINFDQLLKVYLLQGYDADKNAQNNAKNNTKTAIGFVMTVYRKLAASSIAAIEQALSRRLQKLLTTNVTGMAMDTVAELEYNPFEGEWEESAASGDKREFFTGEVDQLKELIVKARELLKNDQKIRMFTDNIIHGILLSNPKEKVLIFSEYRGTQVYIAQALRDRYGDDVVELIHGGMNHIERQQAIARFEDSGQFLISTEAGGEGINLQRECHIMVNFDLPWNPMRLIQRVGRLYRYGQKKKVVVFNIHANQTLDAQIMNTMYLRIKNVVNDLSILGGEFKEGLEDEIIGQMVDMLDVESILRRAITSRVTDTEHELEKALNNAKEATASQKKLFESFASYNPNEAINELKLSTEHLQAFVAGMMQKMGIALIEKHHNGSTWDIRLPESVRNDLFMGTRQRCRITFDREIAVRRSDIQMMDFNSPLLTYLIETAKRYDFDGRVAALRDLSGIALSTAMLRWQNDQGIRMREEFMAALVKADGSVVANPPSFIEWLLRPAEDGAVQNLDKTMVDTLLESVDTTFESRLAELSNQDLHPENKERIGVGSGMG